MTQTQDPAPWHDTTLSSNERAALLLAAMTLEEKVAQLVGHWEGFSSGDEQAVAPEVEDTSARRAPLAVVTKHGLGQITRPMGTLPLDPVDGMARLAALQRVVLDGSRLRIPAMAHEECLNGLTVFGATIFPASLGLAATWNAPDVRAMTAAIGERMRELGIHQGLAPVLDVVRDYRWGRVEETFGEDPYLIGVMGVAYVEGLQSSGVIATLKHLAGYSTSVAGRNAAPATMGPRELVAVVLPPFHRSVVEAGVRSVMPSYSAIDGVPSHADRWLVHDVLRETWGFAGTVVSDYWGVTDLANTQRVASDEPDAARLALEAGVDVELPDALAFPHVCELVRTRVVDESLVDRSALKVLEQKASLGLLDAGWEPAEPTAVDLDSAHDRALARSLAEQSVVLLSNAQGVLPIAPDTRMRVAVVGPNADDARGFFSCYAYPNHLGPNFPGLGLGVEAPTVLEALRAALPHASVGYSRGCDHRDSDRSGIAAAVDLVAGADLAVVVLGDKPGLFGGGTSGEGCDVTHLELPGLQGELLDAALATGTPIVLVNVSGRPYVLGNAPGRAAAVLQAFLPGEEGGVALAAVLTGAVSPSGRLPVQIPARDTAMPGTYLHPHLADSISISSRLSSRPEYPFGFGLGYTTFEVVDALGPVGRMETGPKSRIDLDVGIANTGNADGVTVVQVYASQRGLDLVQPLRRLVGFARVILAAGQRRELRLSVPVDLLGTVDRAGRTVVVPGRAEFAVGLHERDREQVVTVDIEGPQRVLDNDRAWATTVEER